MFKNFLKVAYRNLWKSKGSSLINIFGLSVAIGCSIVVFLFLELQFTMDRFHEEGERIFLIENYIDRDGTQQLWGDSPRPLGPALLADVPQIEQMTRVGYGEGSIQRGQNAFHENLWFVDNNFLSMLTFPLKSGDLNALEHEDAIVLSEQMALKYFGQADPLGQQISITFENEVTEAFTVRAVSERFPANASFRFSALIPFDKQRVLGEDLNDWEAFTGATFVKLQEAGDLAVVESQLDQYIARQNAANQDWPVAAFKFENLYSMSINSHKVWGDISNGTHPAALIVLSLIAIFLLTLSCFNYINIAIANASRRIKEIGVRKVVGSDKKQLIAQFLTENTLLCVLSLGLGIAVAYFFLLPVWNSMFNFLGDEIKISFAESQGLWIALVALLALTGLASGGYPAFYVSRFQPITIIRGQQTLGSGNIFTRVFLTLQFVLAFITMITGVVFMRNASFQASRDWGYNQEQTYVVPISESWQYAAFQNELEQIPNVVSFAGSRSHIGISSEQIVVDIQGKKVEAVRFDVGFGYLETLDFGLKEGRFFGEAYGTDRERVVLINETFARNQDWDVAIGEQVRIDSLALTVVGVVEDFHYHDFYERIRPTMFFVSEEAGFEYISMTFEAGTGMQMAGVVESTWKRLFPDQPYNGFFQDTVFASFFRETNNIKHIFTFVALMALIISCMGLFGLASQNIARRMKEISIRKVLGASVGRVAVRVNRAFIIQVFLAAVTAIPLSYFFLTALLNAMYAFPMTIGPQPFVLAFMLVFLTAVGAISSLIYKVVFTNPAEVLRDS